MANNCLITELKGQINNDDLVRLGEFKIASPYSKTAALTENQCKLDVQNCTVRVNKGGYFALTFAGLDDPASRLTEIDLSSEEKNLYFANGEYDIFIGKKNTLRTLYVQQNNTLFSQNLENLKYCKGLYNLSLMATQSYGDIANLSYSEPLAVVSISNNNSGPNGGIYGDISTLSGKPIFNLQIRNLSGVYGNLATALSSRSSALSVIDVSFSKVSGTTSQLADVLSPLNRSINMQFTGTEITGDIIYFAPLTKQTTFYFSGSKVYGVLDNLIEALRPSKTTGDQVYFDFSNTQVKYHSADTQPMTTSVTITF